MPSQSVDQLSQEVARLNRVVQELEVKIEQAATGLRLAGELFMYTEDFSTDKRGRGIRMVNSANADILGFIGMRNNAKGDLIVGVNEMTTPADTSIAFSTASDDNGEIIFRSANTFVAEIDQNGLRVIGSSAQDLIGTSVSSDEVTIDGFFRLGLGTELTIASGAVTVTSGFHTIDTESDASSDTLDTINGGANSGDLLLLRAEDSGRSVIVAEGGNIGLESAGSFTMDNATDYILLVKHTTTWQEISRSNNAA